MNEHAYKNWTQDHASPLAIAGGQKKSLATLLRLAREDEASLKADLADVSAARAAAARSVRLTESHSPQNAARLSAARRLLDSLERSEGDIRARLAMARADAGQLAGLIARFHVSAESELAFADSAAAICA